MLSVQGVPQPLRASADKMVFGASTRVYVLQHQTAVSQGNSKRGGDVLLGPASKQAKTEGSAKSQATEHISTGQFAHVVRTNIQPMQPAVSPMGSVLVSKHETASARTKPDFQRFASEHLKRAPVPSASGLYDMLPPVKTKEVH